MDIDPTIALTEIRKIIGKPINSATDWQQEFESLSMWIEALDEWMTKGGFLPVQWRYEP